MTTFPRGYLVLSFIQKKLIKLEQILDAATDSQVDKFDMVRPLNLHFTIILSTLEVGRTCLSARSYSLMNASSFSAPTSVGSKKPQAIADLETTTFGGCDIHLLLKTVLLCDRIYVNLLAVMCIFLTR